MSLKVSYKIAQSATEAFHLAQAQITPEYVKKFNIPCEIDYFSGTKTITASGKGFTLNLLFTEDQCDVSLKLSFLLKPLKKKILGTIESKLSRSV